MYATLVTLALLPAALSHGSLGDIRIGILQIGALLLFAIVSLFFGLYLQQSGLKAALKIDQKKLSGYLLLYRQQLKLRLLGWALLLIPLLQIALTFSPLLNFGLLIVFGALFIDTALQYMACSTRSLSDDGILEVVVHHAERCLKSKDQEGALNGCQQLCQVALSAVQSGLFLPVLAAYRSLLKLFESMLAWAPLVMLFSSKEGGAFELSLIERLQIVIVYVLKKISSIIHLACLKGQIESVEEGIAIVAKMSCLLSQKHPELTSLPFTQLVQTFEQLSIRNASVDAHVGLAISETIKSILLDIHDTKAIPQQPLIQLIRILESHMKRVMERSPTISMALVLQPFAEIGQLLAASPLLRSGELEPVRQELQRLFAQFVTLESLQTTPAGVGATGDSTASFSQDMPFVKPSTPSEA